jgi:catechol 2,3-dioxygenase-like lactoylglutathione lyase family enzyme
MMLSFDHAQITVPKNAEGEARAFYCEVLGLKEIAKPENRKNKGGFWLALGDAQVHVSLEEGVDRMATRAHIAYRVKDLEAWRKRLETVGIKVSESLPFPNARAVEFRDPFGNRAELIEYHVQSQSP